MCKMQAVRKIYKGSDSPLTDDNLISLCKDCHDAMHPEKKKKKSGYQNEEKW